MDFSSVEDLTIGGKPVSFLVECETGRTIWRRGGDSDVLRLTFHDDPPRTVNFKLSSFSQPLRIDDRQHEFKRLSPFDGYGDFVQSAYDKSGLISSIGEFCFVWEQVSSAVFPGVLSIGGGAFANQELKNAVFPEALNIGAGAFCNNTEMISAVFPKLERIDDAKYGTGMFDEFGSFRGCSNLSSVDFGNLKYAGTESFANCGEIREFSAPNLFHAGDGAFIGTSSLTKADFENLSSVGDNTFAGSGISSFSMPNLKTVDFASFSDCRNLVSASTGLVERLESDVFSECVSMISAVCPKATYVGLRAFWRCYALRRVEFLAENLHLGAICFYQTNLKQLVMPNLTAVPTLDERAFDGAPTRGISAYVPDRMIDSFRQNAQWNALERLGQIELISI